MSKKKAAILIVAGTAVFVGVVLFALFGVHHHEWREATCTEPATCVECEKTMGEALGHTWEEATCTLAATCSVCGETEGEALGHTWEEATCTLAATCNVCGETEGEALGHTWNEADYQTAASCAVCGETEGTPLAGWFEENQLTCVSEENKSYEYSTSISGNPEEKTVGHIIMSGYKTFDSNESHPALEGYEWITAQFEVIFDDRNSWRYGNDFFWIYTDYYTPDLCSESTKQLNEEELGVSGEYKIKLAAQYSVNYNGNNYDQCICYFTEPKENEIKYTIYSMVFDSYFLVPKGYDGTVVVFFDPVFVTEEHKTEEMNSTEDSQSDEIGYSVDDSVFIRLKENDQKTDYPQMTVVSNVLPVQPGETIENKSIIRSNSEYKSGFYDLQKIAELEDYDKDKIWIRNPVYSETTFTDEIELISELEIPEEKGVYEVTAAVMNDNGNAVTATITILVDGKKPGIHVPKEKITLKNGDVFAPMEGVYSEDNLCQKEDCYVYMDMDELQKLADGIQAGKAGTYNLTYFALDMAGNMGTKTISVTLSSGRGSQNTSNTGNNNQQGQNTGNNNQQTNSGNNGQQSQEPQFMESMAKEAFDIVNQYRADAGKEALTWNDSIYEGTKIRAQEIVTSFSHTRPSGESCFTVISGFSTYGENIAYGQRSASQVCTAWYNSEGHKNNMLNDSFTQGAIACWYQNGTYYWVNLFGG